MKPSVLAVVINWRRPLNIPAVLAGLRAQTVPVFAVLVECSYGTELACQDHAGFDDVIRLGRTNLGPSSRFVPALAYTGFPYTFFAVDDYVPGPECVAKMLQTASRLDDIFSTIGQDGRRVEGDVLVKRRVKMLPSACAKVDVVTTSELVRTDMIPLAISFRNRLAEKHPDVSLFEDDMILCMGLQLATDYPCYLTPDGPGSESWRVRQLPDNEALSARPDHQDRRNHFLACAKSLGWRSLT